MAAIREVSAKPASQEQVEAPVRITETLGERLFRGELPNGKIIIAFIAADDAGLLVRPGDEAVAVLSLGDFSRGRIVRKR